MKILVIGGSYFYGRVFVMSACNEHEITLLNRGTYPMYDFPVKEIHADRSDADAVKKALMNERFDAVVDFCAYNGEAVSAVFDALSGCEGGNPPVYILISTADVLKHKTGKNIITDDDEYEDALIGGETGEYIRGKIEAEKVFSLLCEKNEVKGVILRPTVIYGPYDYSQRFSSLAEYIITHGIVPDISDATGSFDCIYIRDAVNMILGAIVGYAPGGNINNSETYVIKYILAGAERCSYGKIFDVFADEAKKAGISAEPSGMNFEQLKENGISAVFAQYEDESLYYDGSRAGELLDVVGAGYTGLEEGLGKTFRFFK